MQPENINPQQLGIVIIGRNEGERLSKCLASVTHLGHPVVYVDSGSADDSVARATSCRVDVVELDPKRPFSAARARNEGFSHLLEKYPGMEFVQFLDGDCTLFAGWLDAAVRALQADDRRAAVIGHRLEWKAKATIYNRLCAMEWHSQPGELTNFGGFGGDSLIRTGVFAKMGGFRPNMIAGEDSELGVRIGIAGFKITKLDCPMSLHDANMTRFSQWWQRSVRSGHAYGQRFDLNGKSVVHDCQRERNSIFFWGLALPLLMVITSLLAPGALLIFLAAYIVLAIRIWRYRKTVGDPSQDALLYAGATVLGKFAHAIGLIKFFINKLNHRFEIIEYK